MRKGYVLLSQDGRSGSQWTASTHRHWHGFGNRSYDGQQNTFRRRCWERVSPRRQAIQRGVSYLYDDFSEVEPGAQRQPMQRRIRRGVRRTCLARFWKPPGLATHAGWSSRDCADQHNLWGTVVMPRLRTVECNGTDVRKWWPERISDAQRVDGGAGVWRATGRDRGRNA